MFSVRNIPTARFYFESLTGSLLILFWQTWMCIFYSPRRKEELQVSVFSIFETPYIQLQLTSMMWQWSDCFFFVRKGQCGTYSCKQPDSADTRWENNSFFLVDFYSSSIIHMFWRVFNKWKLFMNIPWCPYNSQWINGCMWMVMLSVVVWVSTVCSVLVQSTVGRAVHQFTCSLAPGLLSSSSHSHSFTSSSSFKLLFCFIACLCSFYLLPLPAFSIPLSAVRCVVQRNQPNLVHKSPLYWQVIIV